ncbi:UNVERIFIED_ORG: hypothetical protein QOE_3503 [Clostridioides difficile F501]
MTTPQHRPIKGHTDNRNDAHSSIQDLALLHSASLNSFLSLSHKESEQTWEYRYSAFLEALFKQIPNN